MLDVFPKGSVWRLLLLCVLCCFTDEMGLLKQWVQSLILRCCVRTITSFTL